MLGCDIIGINRVKDTYSKYGDRFISRILTPKEIEIFYETPNKINFLAGRFAAKEAISKSLKVGIGKDLSFHDIEISNDKKGAPIATVLNSDVKLEISISHCKEYAMAVSIIV